MGVGGGGEGEGRMGILVEWLLFMQAPQMQAYKQIKNKQRFCLHDSLRACSLKELRHQHIFLGGETVSFFSS